MKILIPLLLLIGVAGAQTPIAPSGLNVPSNCTAANSPQIFLQTASSGRVLLYACSNGKYTKIIQFPLVASSETPGGKIDGNNRIFTFAHTPSPGNSLQFYVNGLLWKQGQDYTLSVNKLTVRSVQVAPGAGAKITAFYNW